MLTELFPYCLSISVGQMSPDNGLAHVSLEVGIEDTKHEGLTEFRQPLQEQSHLEMPGILVQLGHIQRT